MSKGLPVSWTVTEASEVGVPPFSSRFAYRDSISTAGTKAAEMQLAASRAIIACRCPGVYVCAPVCMCASRCACRVEMVSRSTRAHAR